MCHSYTQPTEPSNRYECMQNSQQKKKKKSTWMQNYVYCHFLDALNKMVVVSSMLPAPPWHHPRECLSGKEFSMWRISHCEVHQWRGHSKGCPSFCKVQVWKGKHQILVKSAIMSVQCQCFNSCQLIGRCFDVWIWLQGLSFRCVKKVKIRTFLFLYSFKKYYIKKEADYFNFL